MKQMTYKGIKVQYDDSITEAEAREFTEAEKNYWWVNLDHMALGYLTITMDGDEIVLHGKEAPPIQRIRRITGYLVGTTDRWCNAKQAELKDRVKHI